MKYCIAVIALFSFVFASVACGPSPAGAQSVAALATTCSSLGAGIPGAKNVRITKSDFVKDDAQYQSYCLVQGKVNERTGIDGKSYAIGFEMRLPSAWNSRFLYQVNGGNDGVVVPAVGDLANQNALGRVTALARGFAVLSTDAGHSGSDPANASLGLAGGNVFGLDPQARADYGYAATATMTPIAKSIIKSYYGKDPAYSYMQGCSNGGRHGMVAASRYAGYFDGILAGSPGFDLPRAAVQHAWDAQSLRIANPDIRSSFSRDDMKLVAAKIVEKCDALDGIDDGIVSDLRKCQSTFTLSDLQCKGEKNATCLTENQVKALDRAMSGPKNSEGKQLYSTWPYAGGIGAGNWRFWKVESGIPPWGGNPVIAIMGAGSLAYIFTVPPTKIAGDPSSLMKFLVDFDFNRDAPKIFATDSTFKESPMQVNTPLDIDNPKLADFKAKGGKLLIYQGDSDGVFSANDITNWYEKLSANNGGDAGSFARLFLVPGMNHCGAGGPTVDEFNALTALINWVEAGQAPDKMIAAVNPTNPELPASWSKARTRPLCVWPKIAKYKGGDKEKAESFSCELP
jgi:hypothetical protein